MLKISKPREFLGEFRDLVGRQIDSSKFNEFPHMRRQAFDPIRSEKELLQPWPVEMKFGNVSDSAPVHIEKFEVKSCEAIGDVIKLAPQDPKSTKVLEFQEIVDDRLSRHLDKEPSDVVDRRPDTKFSVRFIAQYKAWLISNMF